MAVPLSQSTTAERTKQIPNRIDSLSSRADILNDRLNQLRTNLEGVLLQANPLPAGENAKEPVSQSPIAGEVAGIAQSIEECLSTVADIQSRLDI